MLQWPPYAHAKITQGSLCITLTIHVTPIQSLNMIREDLLKMSIMSKNITVLSFCHRLISLTLIITHTDSAVSSSCESKVDKTEHTNLSAGITLFFFKSHFHYTGLNQTSAAAFLTQFNGCYNSSNSVTHYHYTARRIWCYDAAPF